MSPRRKLVTLLALMGAGICGACYLARDEIIRFRKVEPSAAVSTETAPAQVELLVQSWVELRPRCSGNLRTLTQMDCVLMAFAEQRAKFPPVTVDATITRLYLVRIPGVLDLEVIRRVLSPFAGIGSEGYVALEAGRRFVGVELKRSYYEQAARNLAAAATSAQAGLFSS